MGKEKRLDKNAPGRQREWEMRVRIRKRHEGRGKGKRWTDKGDDAEGT